MYNCWAKGHDPKSNEMRCVCSKNDYFPSKGVMLVTGESVECLVVLPKTSLLQRCVIAKSAPSD
jgi:hypothetical protein